MPDNISQVYEILIKLNADWSKTIGDQSKRFDNFIRKANASSQTLEKSLSGMSRDLGKVYEGLYAQGQTQLTKLSEFAKTALSGISSSSRKIMQESERQIDKITQVIEERKGRLSKIAGAAKLAQEGKLTPSPEKTLAAQKEAQQLVDYINRTVKDADIKITNMLAEHIGEFSESIRNKSRLVSNSTKKLIDDQITQYQRLKNIERISGATPATAIQQAGGIKQMEGQQKAVYANLKQLAEAHKNAQVAYDQQIKMSHRAVGEDQKKRFEDLAFIARRNLEIIQKEYLDTAIKAEEFTKKIREQKAALMAKGPGIYESMRDQLKPSRIEPLFQQMFSGLREQAALAGTGMTDALQKSLTKTDQVRGKLKAFKDRLVEIKEQAEILGRMGIIDPNKIGPKINRAERMIADFGATFKKMQQDLRAFKPDFGKFKVSELGDFSKTRKQIAALSEDFKRVKIVTTENFQDTLQDYQKMDKLLSQAVSQRRAAKKKIIQIEKEANRVEQQMMDVHDAEMRQGMQRYIDRLRVHAKNLTKVLQRPVAFDKTDLAAWGSKFETEVKKTIDRVQAYTRTAELTPKKQLNEFQMKYKETLDLIETAGRKKLFKTASVTKAKEETKKLTQLTDQYKARIIELEKELKRLQMMQRAGFKAPGIRTATRELKQYIDSMKGNMAKITSDHNHAIRRMRDVAKVSGKSIFRSGWEMVRNFRWQVAAVIYLVQRAVWAVTRTIGQVFTQIANFRQQAMALAAQFSFKMIGSTKDNFDSLYEYSRTLLERLQLEAARTILTFEDMLMLTKTLAQAGIVPKTDEDIKKISAIGTAIKSLTEGMANAGVQMRQELYAIIAGRQRATDQLAMMFKVMGVNIQDMIDKGRAAGKEIHDILYEALEPFSILNQKMEDEYNAVKNRLQVIWQIIQRVGGEAVLQKFTQQLVDLADALYDTTTGQLTDLGRKIAASINVALNSIMAIANAIKSIFVSWWNAMSSVYSAFAEILEAIGIIKMDTSKVSKEWTALKVISAGIQGVFVTIGNIFKLLYFYIKTSFTILKNIVIVGIKLFKVITSIFVPWDKIKKAAMWIVDNVPGAFKKVWEWVTSILSRVSAFLGKIFSWVGDKLSKTEVGKELVDSVKNAAGDIISLNKEWDDTLDEIMNSYTGIGKSLEEIDKIQTGANKNLELNLKELLKLPYDYMKLMEEAGQFSTDFGQMELKSKTGEDKIETQFQQRINKWKGFSEKLQINLQRMAEFFDTEAAKHLTDKQMKALKLLEQGHRDMYNKVLQYNKMAEDAKAIELEKYNIKLAKQRQAYEQWMRSALMVPETPDEKATQWVEKMKIDLRALSLENKFFKENYEEVLKAIEKGGQIRHAKAIEDMNLAYDKWINKASKADAWNNVFDDINIEFKEYIRQIDKASDLDKDRKIQLREQLGIIKQQRIYQEQLNIAHESYLAQMDVQIKKADLMKGAYSPIKQAEGEILSLRATHNKEMENMRKKLEDFNLQWKRNGEWVEGADENVRALGESYEETMRLMTEATEREIRKKQMPIWNDIMEASKGWADGFTDALSEIVNGVDSVTEALQQLQMQILQDVVRTVIKRSITDQLMDALGSGMESPMSGFFGLFPGGKAGEGKGPKMPQEITATKPIPVVVTNAAALGGAGIASSGMTGMSDWMGEMGDWFSSFGSGAGGGAMDWAGSYGMGLGYAGYGFAEGGRITEPIVGKGLKSGEIYNFGEKTKYGEDEIIAPVKRMQKFSPSSKVEYHMPIHISSIDTQSGVEFLMKHSDTIQGQMVKNLKHNKPIRKGIQNAY